MSTPKEKAQIKTQLFTSLTQLGIQQQLKKQLRVQICQKLKQKDLLTSKKQQTHQDKLYTRIMASVVSEYLIRSDCGYSNSIFVAESGYDMKTLERKEIVEVLGMGDGDFDARFSVLDNIMKRKYPFNGGTYRTISVQTSPEEIGYTLEQRLALIDQQYRRNISTGSTNRQEIDYKKKIEQLEYDLKRVYERDLERFKEFQTHAIKVRVGQEWRKKFEDYARNISEEYRRKMEHLRKKERLLEDDIVNKTKVLDEKVNGTHKTFLQKIDILDIKSSTVEETKRNLDMQRKRAQQQFSQAQKQLKTKIRQYDNLLLTIKSKIDYEVNIAKLALQQEYQQKNTEFLTRKKYIDEQYGKLMGIKDTTDVIKEESKRLFQENLRLRKDLTELEQELRVMVSEGAAKGDRVDGLRAQAFKLEKELRVKEEAYAQMLKRYKKKQEQIVEIRREIDELRRWKQKNEKNDQSSIDLEAHEDPRQPPTISGSKTEIQTKLDVLKKQRKRQIQKLKLQLLS